MLGPQTEGKLKLLFLLQNIQKLAALLRTNRATVTKTPQGQEASSEN